MTDEGALLDRSAIEDAFRPLGDRLARRGVVADLYIFGGAAMSLVYIAAAVQVKVREHEALLADYGNAMAAVGWRPITRVHPRDLELSRAGETWLAEVKMVYGGRVTSAVREALAQFLAYRYFFYQAVPQPGLLAVFSEERLVMSARGASGNPLCGGCALDRGDPVRTTRMKTDRASRVDVGER
jgi:hypothetical protein